MSKLLKIISAIAVLGLLVVPVYASPQFGTLGQGQLDQYFLVDHAAFNSETVGKVRLEVYYQIYNASLNFFRQENSYVADYEISVNVYGKDDRLVDSYMRTKRVKVNSDEKAKSEYDYRTNQVNYELDPGKYEVKLILSDPNSDQFVEQKFKVKLKYKNEGSARISDIQLVQAAENVGEKPTKFDKGNFTLIPSVSHKYGTSDALKLLFYFEVYQGKSDHDSVFVETKLRHSTKGMVYRDSLTSKINDGVLRQFREISMDKLRPGDFRLTITLKGKRNKKIDSKTKYYELVWSEKSTLSYDFKSVIGQLSLISQPSELDALKGLEEYEHKLEAFNQFWLVRDPTPGTAENETKNEFYRRVNVANQNFSYLRTSGWKTDRGRVYVIYGEPDQIEDYPFSLDRLPYQEWQYYRDARYRKFVFIDETGDGDFRLIYPFDGLGLGPEY